MANPRITCLAFGAHPDDVELFCAGIIIKMKKQSVKTVIVDLTRAELSTNGDPQRREEEARQAAKIMRIDNRYNLALPDGEITNTYDNRLKIISLIRKLRPQICVLPYWKDRHPDHVAASQTVRDSLFYAGLSKIETGEQAFRPDIMLYYMLHKTFKPTFILDISDEFKLKMKAIYAYQSQFQYNAQNNRESYINKPEFLEMIETRAKYFGNQIHCRYGEPYYYEGILKINDPLVLLD
jgi:bacillithiol biosynthesis deacetylase BshB1